MFQFLYAKDPDEKVDYEVDWTSFIGSELIVSQVLTVTGADILTASIDAASKKVVFRVAGGTPGSIAVGKSKIVTDSGQEFERRFRLRIKDR